MASKLQNLEVTKVDFVDRGDNKEANVVLFKRAPDGTEPPDPSPEASPKADSVFKRFVAGLFKSIGATESQTAIIMEEIAKGAQEQSDDTVQKSEPENHEEPAAAEAAEIEKSSKGEYEMKIDKSKLSQEELATLEAIEKKAGIPDDTPAPPPAPAPSAAPAAAPAPVDKSAPAPAPADDPEDIYKGMHPAVAEELKNLRKFREEQEDRDMLAVAKKYELLGKKPEELAPVLKSLKAHGGTAYADMIGVLDASLATVEASPAFNEIGKRGTGVAAAASSEDAAWSMIEKKAEEIMKSAPTMTRAQAIDKACQQNPELVHQYENTRF